MIATRAAWMLGAALLLPLIALSVRRWQEPVVVHRHAVPVEIPAPLTHPLLEGSASLPDGSRIIARLRPWRADPRRQVTEAAALLNRLSGDCGLDPSGQLHELELEHQGPGSTALEVLRPQVVDAQGPCLHSLPAPSPLGDPFLSLAAGAEGVLQPGVRVRGLLWGQLPTSGARLLLPLPVELHPQ